MNNLTVLKGKKIVIGITGSIAAYKIPMLIRLLIKNGAEVQVIMTPMAKEFVTPLTLSTLSQRPVIIDPFITGTGEWNNHVELGQWADLMLFAPVTANTLSKMARGSADNFLITAYLSAKCPVYIAPAMDLDMYSHPSTQQNICTLQSYGNTIIEPQTGELASGLTGQGRLEEPAVIFNILVDHFKKSTALRNRKVMISAGPTQENIDPVRYISNHSSGQMGFCLAKEAASRGASVTLITGPVNLKVDHPSIKLLPVVTASEMHHACLKAAPGSDIIIMAAAVADFTPANVAKTKIKKGKGPLSLNLEPTPDILSDLGKMKTKDQVLVGFALETDQEMTHAKTKLKEKNLDLIVLNSLRDTGAGFGYNTNKVTVIEKSGKIHRGLLKPKNEVAADIWDIIMGK